MKLQRRKVRNEELRALVTDVLAMRDNLSRHAARLGDHEHRLLTIESAHAMPTPMPEEDA